MDSTMEATGAEIFLDLLEVELHSLPVASELTPQLDLMVARRNLEDTHLFRREAAFVNHFVVPIVSRLIRRAEYLGDHPERARVALRNESQKGMEQFTSATATWRAKHPFHKQLPASPELIYEQWKRGKGMRDSWPDFMVSDPDLPAIVFECKYFVGRSDADAQRDLVAGLYEAMFYRGAPHTGSDRHARRLELRIRLFHCV
jgi:hypothetical protein